MEHIYEYLGQIILMAALLICSAFFSGSETAFFNLTTSQIHKMKRSKNKLHNLVAALLDNPSQLLSAFLFGNTMVNIIFFALSSMLLIRLEKDFSTTISAAVAVTTFLCILFLGEIFPKTFCYANSRLFSTITALPVYILLKIINPIIFILKFFIIEPALRILIGTSRTSRIITQDEFKTLMDFVTRKGIISAQENRLLTEIIELSSLKVKDCLRPRVDMLACEIDRPPSTAVEKMMNNNRTKIPVYHRKKDDIKGMVFLKDIILNPDKSLKNLAKPAFFVPEQQKIESLLLTFRNNQIDTAIVVDEYGGIEGSIRLEDIAEEIFGPLESPEEKQVIEHIAPFEYRLAGNLSIHDWAAFFGIDPEQLRITTIGGFVAALLGKIPHPDDSVKLKNLTFTVETVEKRRIKTLKLKLEPIEQKQND